MELKAARDERGFALASAGSWEDSVMAAREQRASTPKHIVSDGDKAIESAIDMAYGRRLRISCVNFIRCASTSAT